MENASFQTGLSWKKAHIIAQLEHRIFLFTRQCLRKKPVELRNLPSLNQRRGLRYCARAVVEHSTPAAACRFTSVAVATSTLLLQSRPAQAQLFRPTIPWLHLLPLLPSLPL